MKNYYEILEASKVFDRMVDVGQKMNVDKITWDENGNFYFWKNNELMCVADLVGTGQFQ